MTSCFKSEPAIFGVLNQIKNLSWFCEKCVNNNPGVHKLLIRVGMLTLNMRIWKRRHIMI